MPIQNAEIAAMFDQTAELLEIEGANPFRVRAYCRAARTIETLPQSVVALIAGIGKDLAGKRHYALASVKSRICCLLSH